MATIISKVAPDWLKGTKKWREATKHKAAIAPATETQLTNGATWVKMGSEGEQDGSGRNFAERARITFLTADFPGEIEVYDTFIRDSDSTGWSITGAPEEHHGVTVIDVNKTSRKTRGHQ